MARSDAGSLGVVLTGASSKFCRQVMRLAAALPGGLSNQRAAPAVRQRQEQRRLEASQVEQLIDAYRSGVSMRELASQWGLHRTTVASHLRQAGVALRRQGIPATRLDEAIRYTASGGPASG